MIVTRDAHTDDEAWMLEKLNQRGGSLDSFSPRDFMLAVDDETEERFAFGRTEYIRNVDDTEYVELNSFVLLDRGNMEHGCLLVSDLVESVKENDQNQVFAFPHENQDVFLEVGFYEVGEEELPTVMAERLTEKQNIHSNATAMVAEPRNVEFTTEDEEDDEFEKPDEVSDDEVEKIKDELELEDSSTKYQVD